MAIIGAAALIDSASKGGGYGSSNRYYKPSKDYDWDWDYMPANGQWACRGIQTGRFAETYKCAYDIKDDNRWPG